MMPLNDLKEHLRPFVGLTTKTYLEFRGRKQPLTFNLSEEIRFESSDQYYGLQMADIFASSLGYAVQNQEVADCKKWLRIAFSAGGLSGNSIFPDSSLANPRNLNARRNKTLLKELLRRSRNGEDLLANLDIFVSRMVTGTMRRR